jgi:hypothetical protein
MVRSVCTFYELKCPKWKQPLNISETVFYKQVLEFHCPSKFLCQTSGRQNHWSLVSTLYKKMDLLISSVLDMLLRICRSSLSFLSSKVQEKTNMLN